MGNEPVSRSGPQSMYVRPDWGLTQSLFPLKSKLENTSLTPPLCKNSAFVPLQIIYYDLLIRQKLQRGNRTVPGSGTQHFHLYSNTWTMFL